jgi:hypothetical protein
MGHDQLIVLWGRVEAAICISIVFHCQCISEPEVRSRFYGRSNFKFNPVSGCSAGILASRDEVQFGVIFIRVIVASVLLSRTLAEMVPFGHCIRILIQCSTRKDTLTSSTIVVSEIRIRAVAGAFQHSHVSTQAMHAVLNSNTTRLDDCDRCNLRKQHIHSRGISKYPPNRKLQAVQYVVRGLVLALSVGLLPVHQTFDI